MPEKIIKTQNLHLEHCQREILKDVNIEIFSQDFVYLVGKTGSGKSSFLRALYADLALKKGTAWVCNFEVSNINSKQIPFLRRKVGIIFQNFQLLWDRNVYKNLEFVLLATDWRDEKKIKNRIQDVLQSVGLEGKEQSLPHQLSGGEQQRVGVARALLNDAALIIADEPTGNLDPETSKDIIQLLYNLKSEHCAVLMATHNYDMIRQFPGKVFECKDQKIYLATGETLTKIAEYAQ
jgi:cell division transport system ATP-binding protein